MNQITNQSEENWQLKYEELKLAAQEAIEAYEDWAARKTFSSSAKRNEKLFALKEILERK